MSKYNHPKYGAVIKCDICAKIGAVYDASIRRMKNDAQGQPQHVCDLCRPHTVWCEHHSAYHRKDGNHRRTCVSCGGLFTSAVAHLELEHCPSCRRALPPLALPKQAPRTPTLRSWVGRLLTQHS